MKILSKEVIERDVWYVYRHIRLDKNEVFYIGIGKVKNNGRAYDKKYRNNYWINITNIYSYNVEILFEGLSKDKAIEKEIEFIKLYGRKDLGLGSLVNMTDGGEAGGNKIISKETREKMSKWQIGRKIPLETRIKFSKAKLGNKAAKGHVHTKETIEKILNSRSWYKETPETKERRVKSLREFFIKNPRAKGRKHSEETKDKIRLGNKGKILSEETKLKMSLTKKLKYEKIKQGSTI